MNTALSEKNPTKLSFALPYRRILLFLSVFAVSACLVTHPEAVKSTVTDALSFCFRSLIPSLFPFAVAGEILVSAGFGELCEGLCGSRLMRGRGLSAFLLGALCGFPIGGKTALSFCENGELDKNEAELLCALSNNAGVGFVIAGIGSAMWKSTTFGAVVYAVQLISALIAAYILKPFFGYGKSSPQTRDIPTQRRKEASVAEMISTAVPNAVFTMLKICGFVIFFELIISVISLGDLSPFATAILSAILEITSGVTAFLHLTIEPANVLLAKLGTFFAVGFGGLSVHFQLASFIESSAVTSHGYMYRYAFFKLIQAILCVIIGAAAIYLLGV